jgi:hypothetical protein
MVEEQRVCSTQVHQQPSDIQGPCMNDKVGGADVQLSEL